MVKWQKVAFKFEKQYRLKNWDYSSDGFYFITICTKDRENYFGDIQNDKMKLSQIGMVTQKYLLQIPMHYKNILIDEFSIMPNHVHILLNNGVLSGRPMPWSSLEKSVSNSGRHMPWHVPTKNINYINTFSHPIKNSISMVINHYKSAVTKEINKSNQEFSWQTRFHDEIIKNEKHYWAVKRYIKNNVINWNKDKENI
ncbi:MAG TPA: transposase [Candidatus Woesebacteria bacterium]|nr:transposase [Candidatus Shapirobacteria bacterium]HOY61179.1 transposase [Candidatus Woesebacteria bacterium]